MGELQFEVEDQYGNPDAYWNVSLSLDYNGSPDTNSNDLEGTVTATTGSNGIATFPGIIINNTGGPYTLVASSDGLTSLPSGAINVVLPNRVRKLPQAPRSPPGVSFPVSFLVETAQGTLDPDYSGAVMLSVFTGPAGYLPISGVVPENPSNGTVSFPAVILDTVGS